MRSLGTKITRLLSIGGMIGLALRMEPCPYITKELINWGAAVLIVLVQGLPNDAVSWASAMEPDSVLWGHFMHTHIRRACVYFLLVTFRISWSLPQELSQRFSAPRLWPLWWSNLLSFSHLLRSKRYPPWSRANLHLAQRKLVSLLTYPGHRIDSVRSTTSARLPRL